jgi:hypothetical protein
MGVICRASLSGSVIEAAVNLDRRVDDAQFLR